jgi:hypothetical protein
MLERSLSVDIYNKDNDTALAITAIRCAIDDTPDAGDKAKFQGDLATLERRGGGGGVQAAGSGVLLEIMKMMAEVSKDTGSPSARFQKLERARPKLKTWAAKNPGNEQCKLLLKAFAMMERGLSVDIVNKEVPEAVKKRQFDRVKELVGLALLAINHAMEDTPDEDDRRKFRNDRKQLDKLAEGMGGVTIPTPDPDPDTPSTAPKGRTPWIKEQLIYALGFAVSLFLLSFAFRHHYPSGRPVAEFVVQWWHLPVAGFVAGLVLPLGRLPFPLPLVFAIYGFWSWAFTLVAWGVMAVYNAIVPEARELGLWWAPLIGFGIGVPIALLYAVVKKGSGGGKSKTRGSRGSGHPSPWYAGRPASALLFAVSLFLLSFVFRHYYPAGRPVAEILVQWWWFPAAGFVAGLLLPLGKMIHPLPQVGSAFAIWGSISTALVTAIIVAYNGIALETFVPELWRAAIIGFAISGMMIGPYWILTFVSQHAEAPTVPVREASLRRMPLVYLGVMFFLFSFSKDHIPLLAELPMLRWWHFPIAGVVLGFFVPVRTYRSSFFLQFYFMTTWPVTLLVWIGIIVYNAIAPETAAFAKCWAPYMGMALGYFILIFRLERIPVSLARMEKAMVK